MNTIVRAALAVAIVLPFAHPAVAATPVNLRSFAVGSQLQKIGRLRGPKDAFLKLRAHAAGKGAHFTFPYGLATDKSGNLYVANTFGDDVVEVNPNFQVLPGKITQQVNAPVSVATDTSGDVYVGNIGGGVNKYSSNGTLTQTIAANTGTPYGIAVDEYQDLYVTTPTGLAIDDPTGTSLWTISLGNETFSVALGGPTIYTFYNDTYAAGSGSYALRSGNLQYSAGPTGSGSPLGSACLIDRCWYDDSVQNTLGYVINGSASSMGLPYSPAGIAYDALHNRLFVADPLDNKVQVYNATTLAFERAIT